MLLDQLSDPIVDDSVRIKHLLFFYCQASFCIILFIYPFSLAIRLSSRLFLFISSLLLTSLWELRKSLSLLLRSLKHFLFCCDLRLNYLTFGEYVSLLTAL